MTIKICISCSNSIVDLYGQWLPYGNYYFLIKSFENVDGVEAAAGDVIGKNSDEVYINFYFSSKEVIKMMAISQSRILRRSDIPITEHMPKYPSPSTSPVANMPLDITHTTHMEFQTPNRSSSQADTIKEIDAIREKNKCTICLVDIDANQKSLRCGHHFHAHCIDRWVRLKKSCPNCRTSINENNENNNRISRSISTNNIRRNYDSSTRLPTINSVVSRSSSSSSSSRSSSRSSSGLSSRYENIFNRARRELQFERDRRRRLIN